MSPLLGSVWLWIGEHRLGVIGFLLVRDDLYDVGTLCEILRLVDAHLGGA